MGFKIGEVVQHYHQGKGTYHGYDALAGTGFVDFGWGIVRVSMCFVTKVSK